MKKLSLVILIAGLLLGSYSAAEKNDLQLLKLKGRVENLDNGHIAQYFTEDGWLDWEEYENGQDERASRYYNRDEQGRLIYVKDEGTNTYTTNSYDRSGKLVEKQVESDQGDYTIKYSYNSKGELIWLKIYDQDGKLSSATENSYNEMGSKIKTADYDENNALTGYYEYDYDKQQNLIESRQYSAPQELVGKTTYTYDAKNRILQSTDYFLYEDEFHISTGYSYNDQDDVIQTVATYSTDGTTITTKYVYTYDQMGNWTHQEIWNDGEDDPDTIERSIEYYK